jgi:hypothetical protein
VYNLLATRLSVTHSGSRPPVEYSNLLFHVMCDVRMRPPGAIRKRLEIKCGKWEVKSAARAPPSEYPTKVMGRHERGDEARQSRI